MRDVPVVVREHLEELDAQQGPLRRVVFHRRQQELHNVVDAFVDDRLLLSRSRYVAPFGSGSDGRRRFGAGDGEEVLEAGQQETAAIRVERGRPLEPEEEQA